MKKPIVFIFVLTFSILFLSILQVVVSNRMSTAGVSLAVLEDEIKNYRIQNALLSEKLLTIASYTHIAFTADKEGFISAKSEVILTASLPLAVKQ